MFFKKKAPEPPKPAEPIRKVYEIPYSKGFRGFKRFHLTVHGDKESEKNNEKFYNNDFSGSKFEFVCFNYDGLNRVAVLFIDGIKMGCVYDDDQIQAIESGSIERIHIEPKEEVVVGKDNTETRHRISVLVKYKDEN